MHVKSVRDNINCNLEKVSTCPADSSTYNKAREDKKDSGAIGRRTHSPISFGNSTSYLACLNYQHDFTVSQSVRHVV
jgi:hypothetical protein